MCHLSARGLLFLHMAKEHAWPGREAVRPVCFLTLSSSSWLPSVGVGQLPRLAVSHCTWSQYLFPDLCSLVFEPELKLLCMPWAVVSLLILLLLGDLKKKQTNYKYCHTFYTVGECRKRCVKPLWSFLISIKFQSGTEEKMSRWG